MKSLWMSLLGVVLGAQMVTAAPPPAAPAPTVGSWHGYARHSFTFEGLPACIIAPHQAAIGRPWIWKARFLDHRPDLDLALLGLGFHVASIEDNREMLGSPEAIAIYARFHDHVTSQFELAKKAALEGVSRGGLYVYNFAATHPDRVACIVADGAVCDFKSWPAGKRIFPEFTSPGGGKSWDLMKTSYKFASDADARAWTKNPVDNLKPLADAKIPLFHVVGADDDVVPVAENTALIEKRYKELGGTITVVAKPGEKHAHGLADVKPLTDFVVKSTCGQASVRPILAGVKRIVFLGDSITHGGKYVQYVAQYLFTRYPEREFEIINLGLSSETTSGLSEEGHAGGKFPRPGLHDRLDRALAETKPDYVLACYGINDGIYKPLDEQRFAKYREGVTKLADKVKAAGAQFLVLTPPVFDSLPIKAKTSADGNGQPFVDYDQVMAHYSDWLLQQRQSAGWNVADIHGPMLEHVMLRRKTQADFTFSKDGVHPGPAGLWMMTQPILRAWGGSGDVEVASIESGMPRVGRGNVGDVMTGPKGLSFTWLSKAPMPMDPEWDAPFIAIEKPGQRFNNYTLAVTGLKQAKYALFENDQALGEFTREELSKGIDATKLPKLSTNVASAEVRKLTGEYVKTLGDAWRSHVGHNRPGVAKGLPLDEAKVKAGEILQKIRAQCAPRPLALRLEAVAADSAK